jgi:very-short-patch-repair endonuclease
MPNEPEQNTGWAGKYPPPDQNKLLRQRARELRSRQTPAEKRLWHHLKGKQLGHKFRRQHVIAHSIVDFYCAEARLVIEVDGAVHDYTGDHDVARQEHLEKLSLRFLRFTNDDVMRNLDGVITHIKQTLSSNQ